MSLVTFVNSLVPYFQTNSQFFDQKSSQYTNTLHANTCTLKYIKTSQRRRHRTFITILTRKRKYFCLNKCSYKKEFKKLRTVKIKLEIDSRSQFLEFTLSLSLNTMEIYFLLKCEQLNVSHCNQVVLRIVMSFVC